MPKKVETVEARAVKIAAHCLAKLGVCRYDDPRKCRRTGPSELACSGCIREWLMKKAREELS